MPPRKRVPDENQQKGEQQLESLVQQAEEVLGDLEQRQAEPEPPGGPGLLQQAGIDPDLSASGGAPPPLDPNQPVAPIPAEVRLTRPDTGPTQDQNLWTLIRNRTDAICFNNYTRYLDAVLCGDPRAVATLPSGLQAAVGDLSFLGLDGYDVVRAATEYFLMQEVGLIVQDDYRIPPRSAERLQQRYDRAMGIGPDTDPTQTTEFRRRNEHRLPANWLVQLRDDYLTEVTSGATPRVLPYLSLILERLRDLPIKQPGQVAGDCYGVLPSRVVGPLGLELIWNYWHEEGMIVQAHNAITNRFQNLRSSQQAVDPLARLEIDPLRRLNNVLWGWIQNRPFLLSVRRRAYEYDHQYGITLLGTAAGEVKGADSRSQFISAFHNLLYLCRIFQQQDDDLTIHADGFPILNALRETQLVLTAGAHNQYGDLPWTARVEMLLQMWMLGRPEIREFLGGRVMVPYKESWMDRVDAVKSMMDWTDVNVTHFRDLGVFGEQILLSIRYGSWATEIDPAAAVNWARYWRPEIQGYVHAYRAATGVDLRQTVDTTMPGELLAARLAGEDIRPAAAGSGAEQRAVAGPAQSRAIGAVPTGRAIGASPPGRAIAAPAPHAIAAPAPDAIAAPRPAKTGHELT